MTETIVLNYWFIGKDPMSILDISVPANLTVTRLRSELASLKQVQEEWGENFSSAKLWGVDVAEEEQKSYLTEFIRAENDHPLLTTDSLWPTRLLKDIFKEPKPNALHLVIQPPPTLRSEFIILGYLPRF